MSHKDASLKENVLSFATLVCINIMLGWFLNLSIALLTGSVMSLLLSTMYVFSVIPKFFVAFLKVIYSINYYFVIRECAFVFIYKCNLIKPFVFLKRKVECFSTILLSVILLESMLSKKKKLYLVCIIYYSNFFVFYIQKGSCNM